MIEVYFALCSKLAPFASAVVTSFRLQMKFYARDELKGICRWMIIWLDHLVRTDQPAGGHNHWSACSLFHFFDHPPTKGRDPKQTNTSLALTFSSNQMIITIFHWLPKAIWSEPKLNWEKELINQSNKPWRCACLKLYISLEPSSVLHYRYIFKRKQGYLYLIG